MILVDIGPIKVIRLPVRLCGRAVQDQHQDEEQGEDDREGYRSPDGEFPGPGKCFVDESTVEEQD